LLLFLSELQSLLVFGTHAHLPLNLVLVDVVVFLLLSRILTADDGRGHPVHEFLRATLTHFELVLAIRGLLVQHGGVVLLRLDVLDAFGLSDLVLLSLVPGVLLHHLLEIELLLVAFIGKHLSLGVHLCLQTQHQILVLLVVGLLLDALALLVEFELPVARLLLSVYFLLVLVVLGSFTGAKECNVLSLHSVVGHVLRVEGLLAGSLVHHLPVELLLDQTLALSLAELLLLLLLVVQKCVEFLDCEPFILLVDLGVDVSLSGLHRRGH